MRQDTPPSQTERLTVAILALLFAVSFLAAMLTAVWWLKMPI